jgi:hypothetical protein|tara:strand:- start:1247 stop:1807 length:561 start_codon:yes stop_codon:yes gene_type:complete
MTTIYDGKILEITSNWRYTNDIYRKVGGDKSAILQACKRLVEMDYLEVKPDSNKICYKRKDSAQSEFSFIKMLEIMEKNQKVEIHALKQFPNLLMKDGKRLRQKANDVLEHINEEVSRAYMVKTRLDYQKNLSIIPNDVAEKRIKQIDKYIEKIMTTVISKNKDKATIKAIQEYFQNHTTKFEFKI